MNPASTSGQPSTRDTLSQLLGDGTTGHEADQVCGHLTNVLSRPHQILPRSSAAIRSQSRAQTAMQCLSKRVRAARAQAQSFGVFMNCIERHSSQKNITTHNETQQGVRDAI